MQGAEAGGEAERTRHCTLHGVGRRESTLEAEGGGGRQERACGAGAGETAPEPLWWPRWPAHLTAAEEVSRQPQGMELEEHSWAGEKACLP